VQNKVYDYRAGRSQSQGEGCGIESLHARAAIKGSMRMAGKVALAQTNARYIELNPRVWGIEQIQFSVQECKC